MATAKDVAKYLLTLQDEESGDLISNLKLQKLLYYAQGYHLALFKTPLFAEQIQAWEHGPVVPAVWREYKQFSAGAIPIPTDYSPDKISTETKQFLREVYKVVGQYSAWKLRNMTHAEPPWKNAVRNAVITHKALKEYFTTLLK